LKWFGEKMLPRGLPELIYQVTPDWILDDLKVVVLPRKEKKGVSGRIGWHGCWLMRLYTTVILARTSHNLGVRSFNYWLEFLRTALHEIGHIADPRNWAAGYGCRYENDHNYYFYIESLADAWRDKTIALIKSRDDRVGQPKGWIGGLPGIYLIRHSNWAKETQSKCDGKYQKRMADVRAYKCVGQMSLSHVAERFCSKLDIHSYEVTQSQKKLRRLIKKIAPDLGITRHYIDKAGRKHLFFTYGESIRVGEALLRTMKENGLLQHIERERAIKEKIQTHEEELADFERPV